MPSREAARLFKALAPRPITRGELGCDNPAELKRELQRLIGELGPRLAGLDDFQVRNVADQPLRVQWRLPSLASAAALQRELNGVSTLLQLDLPPVSASGHAALLGCLSLPRMLARHPALLALHGNPKAISLAVSLLLPDAVTPRPLSDVGTLIERQRSNSSTSSADADAEPPLADSCRQVLEQLQEILSPPSPTKSPAAEKSPPATPTAAGGGPAVRGADDGTDDADPACATFSSVNEPVALAGEKPAVIFIDECDTMLSARAPARVGHFAKRFERFTDNLLVIGATNEPDNIAPKILTGRFERKIFVDNPNSSARRAMLRRQLSEEDNSHMLSAADIEFVVEATAGRSGVNMERLISSACTAAAGMPVGRDDFETALEGEPSDFDMRTAKTNAKYDEKHGWHPA